MVTRIDLARHARDRRQGLSLEQGGDEGDAHRVRRVAPIEAQLASAYAYHAIDCVRVDAPAFVAALTAVAERLEQGLVGVGCDTRNELNYLAVIALALD
jgi:hypothetical protein